MNKRTSLGFTPSCSTASRRFLPLAPTDPLSPGGPRPHTGAPPPPRLHSDPTPPGRAPFSSYSSAQKAALPRVHLFLRPPLQPPPQYLQPAPRTPRRPPLPSGAALGPGPRLGAAPPPGPRPSAPAGLSGGAGGRAERGGGRVPLRPERRLVGQRGGGETGAWVSAPRLCQAFFAEAVPASLTRT